MSKVVRLSIASLFLSVSVGAGAITPDVPVDELPALEQESQHATASKRIAALFTRMHYKEIELNDQMSGKMFDRFIRQLDFNRNIFLKSDIDALKKFQTRFDEALENGDLTGAYEVYNLNLRRRYERYQYALSLLDKEMDFTKDDEYSYDREEAAWAVSEAELNELWRQRVKYDALNLKITGKNWEEISESLTGRYNRAIKRLKQSKSEDVFQSLMNAFARSIEAHTSYLSPRNADRFQMEMNLSFEGIGAVLQARDDFTVIRSIVPGGPADKSEQLKPEDKIIGVAQEDEDEFTEVIGWRLDEVVELIKGPKGSVVKLQVVKGTATDSSESHTIAITRDKIKLEDRAAKGEIYESEKADETAKRIGVITIPSFYNKLHQDVAKEINSLKEQNIEGLIIDLRGNGGGSLTEATALTGLFIERGPVVQIRNGAGHVSVNRDRDGKVHYDGPLTVLVDRYSASASEIFAAALQDYGRALVVGEQTFGKGTVQQHRSLGRIYDLYDNPLGSVQFTIAKFYRINGDSTQHKGVVPDIIFPSAVVPEEWGESKEENALPWDTIRRTSYGSLGSYDGGIPALTERYQQRVKKAVEFAYILEDIEEYKANQDRETITLNLAARKAEREDNNAKRLKRANERLVRMGKEAVTDLDDVPDEVFDIDPFLDETVNIMSDVMELGLLAKTTP